MSSHYVYDKDNFRFRKQSRSPKAVVLRILKYFLASVSLAILYYMVFALFFSTDKERRLKAENRMYEKMYPEMEQKQKLLSLGGAAPVLWSANYSLGIAVCKRLLQVLSTTPLAGWDVEVTETHHNRKADAPSGTAKLLMEALDPQHTLQPVYGREGLCGPRKKGEIGIHSLRGGTVAGEHKVAFFGEDEVFELTHKAASRRVFAAGALEAAVRLSKMEKGWYTLEEVLFGGDL